MMTIGALRWVFVVAVRADDSGVISDGSLLWFPAHDLGDKEKRQGGKQQKQRQRQRDDGIKTEALLQDHRNNKHRQAET